jgi:phosphorylcholine metabolism protein LicD
MVKDITFNDKIRLRTHEELKAQNNGLVIIKNTLDEIGVINYLSSGTLLGAVRDNDFIPWDWDVQMYLIMENAYPLRQKITKSLVDKGFIIHKFIDSEDALKWAVSKRADFAQAVREGAYFELTAWYVQGKWRYRKKKSMRVPSYLFEGEYYINFKGVKYRTLNPPEKYLEFCYGDWKTPIRSSNKEVYSTSNHLRGYSGINKFIHFFNTVKKKMLSFLLMKK